MRGSRKRGRRTKATRVGERKEAVAVATEEPAAVMVVDVHTWWRWMAEERRERRGLRGVADVVAVHHRRREVFVQNGEGWLNCYRSSPATQISFTLHSTHLRSFRSVRCSLLPLPPLSCRRRRRRRTSLSTHYANTRYQFDGDPGFSYHRF